MDNQADIEAKRECELGWTLFISRRYADSRRHFLKATQLSPDLPQAHLLLGQSYFFQRQPDFANATRAFQRVVSLSPKWHEGYQCLGAVQEEQGQLQEAAVSFERAATLAPEDSRPLMSLGVCLTKLGDYAQAIIHLRRAISLKPHYGLASAHCFLADALRQNGQIKAACEEWRMILRLPAEYPDRDNPHKDARRLLKEYGDLAESR